jgi:5-formyltetrahydrofolate cyclo-ligase
LSPHEQKASLRKQVLRRLAGIPAETRQSASLSACRLLASRPVWRDSSTLLFFAPLPSEIDVRPLMREALEAGKLVALPQFDPAADEYRACQVSDLDRELRPGRFGIQEPVHNCQRLSLNRLDFILVPGVAFDLHGRRLGRGKGYYDRLLPATNGTTCGVAFDEQIVEELPVESHDSDVNCILTPTRWIEL